MAFLTPSFHTMNYLKVYLILLTIFHMGCRGFLKIMFFNAWSSILKAKVGTCQLQKAPLLIAGLKVQRPRIPSEKITTFIFSSCAVALISYCQEASFGTETGHVGSQWLISSHCTLSAFSLNYLRQTSWLAATQTSDGFSPRRPEFGSRYVSDGEEKKSYLFWCFSPLGFPTGNQ